MGKQEEIEVTLEPEMERKLQLLAEKAGMPFEQYLIFCVEEGIQQYLEAKSAEPTEQA